MLPFAPPSQIERVDVAEMTFDIDMAESCKSHGLLLLQTALADPFPGVWRFHQLNIEAIVPDP
jgi:hypothetical protein